MICPNCGAPLPDPAGRPTVVCDHCGSVIAFKLLPAAPAERPAPTEIDPQYDYGPQPSRRPARSELTSVALGPADAAHVIQLLHAGQELEGIQYYQSKVGGSLDEAKDAISAIQSGLQDAAAPRGAAGLGALPDPAGFPVVLHLVQSGNTLDAIKVYRQETGLSLRQAKDAVEALERALHAPAVAPMSVPMSAPARSGNRSRLKSCGGFAAFFGVVVLAYLGTQLGHSDYVQKTAIYRCSLTEIKSEIASQEFLKAPIGGGYPFLVPKYKPAVNVSDWTFSAEYYAPVWGANGWGILDVHLADDSTGSNSVSARLYKDSQWRPVLPPGPIQCRA